MLDKPDQGRWLPGSCDITRSCIVRSGEQMYCHTIESSGAHVLPLISSQLIEIIILYVFGQVHRDPRRCAMGTHQDAQANHPICA